MFGETVRSHRRQLGLTQEALADRIGVSARSIREIESGRTGYPRAHTVRVLADAFGLAGHDRDRFCQALTRPDPRAAARTGAGAAQPAPPAQLPLSTPHFTGRVDVMAVMDSLAACAGDRCQIVVVSGTAGVGKTSFVVHWARRVRHLFPDGQLFVNLRGFDTIEPAVEPAQALGGFLHALDIPIHRVPACVDDQAALLRSLLADRRVLMLLDNARDVHQVRPLLPAGAGCLVVVTSRNRLPGLVAAEGAHPLALGMLTPSEARDMLARRIGAHRASAEPDAFEALIAGCSQLPLALAIVGARIATRPGVPLTEHAAELYAAGDRLDEFTIGDPDTDLRAVFSCSYGTLTPAAARLFRLLGLPAGPDLSLPAVASLVGAPVDRTRLLVAELIRANLLTEPVHGRVAVHDLLRWYAVEQSRRHDDEFDREAATCRLLDHYVHLAHATARLLHPTYHPATPDAPHPAVAVSEPADHQQAMTWLDREYPGLLATIRQAAAHRGSARHAWQLACALATFQDRRGYWHDWTAAQRAALDAARSIDDPAAQAIAERYLGRACLRLGRHEDAHANLRNALHQFEQLDDCAEQARTRLDIAVVLEEQHRFREALDHSRHGLALYRAADQVAGQAVGLNAVGWYHARLGQYQRALRYCRQALDLFQQLGNRRGEGNAWDSLGYVNHRVGNHDDAVACYHCAVKIFRDLGDRFNLAEALTHCGDVHLAAADDRSAHRRWRQSLAILDELGHRNADAVRARLDGTGRRAG
jgi:tetratricopeptide (TPR) repeat protein/DNA-binding XRE family transcriptional regulator